MTIAERLRSFAYLNAWFWLSTTMVMYNKYVFSNLNFPFPITLVLAHMVFSCTLAFVAVRVLGASERKSISLQDFARRVLPIGVFFAFSLYCYQSAYVYLSVSFCQMLKTALPGVTFFTSVAFGVLGWDLKLFGSIVLICGGVIACTNNEMQFHLLGLIFQVLGLIVESIRLVLSEKLLKGVGLSFNPLQMLYYVAPLSAICLLPPFLFLELPALRVALGEGKSDITAAHLVGNCSVAFGLNLAAFLLIGHTSALTMNVAGVLKDCLMIWLSHQFFGSAVTAAQIVGFAVSVTGVKLYNQRRGELSAAAPASPPPSRGSDQSSPLQRIPQGAE
eukprot:TRINITY_DN47666_c0_g1_i1.p2 TRINITY_DN47666_c0_g1~~TRINITY_DN47666_c0_g1_i1.p2  ORF type:complete len:359 (+),score=141.44 TRINITY_DN47666_c0_g1_i1:80-1078(+)